MMDARILIKALGGRWAGSYGVACCPAHDDKNPSLSVSQTAGRVLVRCHGGCAQDAVLAALRARGLWEGDGPAHEPTPAERALWERQAREAEARRVESARRLWGATVPAAGTLAEAYWRSRGITLPLPPSVRFLASAKHGAADSWLPAMVAAVTVWPHPAPMAVHRTYLRADGQGKAPVEPNKAMLGKVRGGAVYLAPPAQRLAVAEGIETAASVMQATGLPCWAALSAGGLEALRLPPPAEVQEVIVFGDRDESGRGQKAAETAAARWAAEGRAVRVVLPPRPGIDFNDMLRGAA